MCVCVYICVCVFVCVCVCVCVAFLRLCGSANLLILATRFFYVYVYVCVSVCFAIRSHCGSANSFRPHNGQNALSEPHRIETLVMSHSLIRSPVRSHRSLTRSLGTACFARAPLRSFARSLIYLLPSSWDNGIFFFQFSMCPESQWNDYEIDA